MSGGHRGTKFLNTLAGLTVICRCRIFFLYPLYPVAIPRILEALMSGKTRYYNKKMLLSPPITQEIIRILGALGQKLEAEGAWVAQWV